MASCRIHSADDEKEHNLLLLMNCSFVMVVHNGDEQQEFIVFPTFLFLTASLAAEPQ